MIQNEIVIRTDHGTPLRLIPRSSGGLMVLQGASHLAMSRAELAELRDAIDQHLARPRLQSWAAPSKDNHL